MEVIYKDDDTQYVGTEKVEQDGQDGLVLVTKKVNLVNGEIQDTLPVEEFLSSSNCFNCFISTFSSCE